MSSTEANDPRDAPRSNVFLSAVLTAGQSSIPVRVRNLSPSGALIDGPDLPQSGRVMLRRGHLSANGEIAWHGDGMCGLRFHDPIDVASWVMRVVHSGQERVDTIVSALKAGVLPHSSSAPAGAPDLKAIVEQLAAIISNLAASSDMTTELAEQILKLEALSKAIENHAAGSSATATVHSLR